MQGTNEIIISNINPLYNLSPHYILPILKGGLNLLDTTDSFMVISSITTAHSLYTAGIEGCHLLFYSMENATDAELQT